MLDVAYDLDIKESELARLREFKQKSIHEIFIYLFAKTLLNEIKRGYHREYVEIRGEERFLRGRLLLSRQIRKLPHQMHTFSILFHEFTEDNLLNQVFYQATIISLENTGWIVNKKLLSELMLIFADVTPTKITKEQLSKIRFTRLNERFKVAFNLAKIILFGFNGLEDEIIGFFVDMNELFEKYVYRAVEKSFPEFKVEYQKSLDGLIYRDGKPMLNPTPDIVVFDGDKIRLIIDAKYKEVINDRGLVPQSGDIYQAYAYSSLGNCDVVLVYPKYGEFNKSLDKIDFTFFNGKKLIVLPFDLDEISTSVKPIAIPSKFRHEIIQILKSTFVNNANVL